jgi:hypothetical protein
MDAISGGVQNLTSMIPGFGDAAAQGLGNTSILGGTGEGSGAGKREVFDSEGNSLGFFE